MVDGRQTTKDEGKMTNEEMASGRWHVFFWLLYSDS